MIGVGPPIFCVFCGEFDGEFGSMFGFAVSGFAVSVFAFDPVLDCASDFCAGVAGAAVRASGSGI
jgi:hypothetical protein